MRELFERLKVYFTSKEQMNEVNRGLRERLSLLDDLRAQLRSAEKQRDYYAELLLTRAGYETETLKQKQVSAANLAQTAVTNWKARKSRLEARASEEAQQTKDYWASKIKEEELKSEAGEKPESGNGRAPDGTN